MYVDGENSINFLYNIIILTSVTHVIFSDWQNSSVKNRHWHILCDQHSLIKQSLMIGDCTIRELC